VPTSTRRTPSTPKPRVARLNRVSTSAAVALRAMRKGAALHLNYTPKGPLWQLSNGLRLTPEAAHAVIADQNVVAVDYALFRDAEAQTWRFAWVEGD
jgi:hypothetical protein